MQPFLPCEFCESFYIVFAFLKFVFYKYLSTRLKAEADWYKKNVLDLIRAATRRELYLQTFYTIPHTYNTIRYHIQYHMLIAENSTCIHTCHSKIHNAIDIVYHTIPCYVYMQYKHLSSSQSWRKGIFYSREIYLQTSTFHKRKVEVDCSKNTELTSTPPLGRVEAPRVPSVEDLNKNVYSYLFLHLHLQCFHYCFHFYLPIFATVGILNSMETC